MRNSFKLALLLVAAGMPCLFSLNASANSITLGNVSEVNDLGGGSDWTFSFSFDNSSLNSGDFFTINDFGAATVVSPPSSPGGTWVFSQALVGPTPFPPGVATDNAGILNVTFTWNGGGPIAVGNAGPYFFTLHSALSVSAVLQVDQYVSIDQSLSDGADSRVVGPLFGPQTVVPDGGMTVAFLGFALVGIEGLRRKLLSK